MTDVTTGDALVAIAAEEPRALKLVGDILERNARSTSAGFEQLYESEKRAHAETRDLLASARETIATIEHRHQWLLGLVDHPDPQM